MLTSGGSAGPLLHGNIDIGALAKKALIEAFRERGHVNVLIAGRTGVGKSTLINAVFQGDMATTGQGKPITQHMREITKGDSPLSIFDTRGLEMADFAATIQELRTPVSERRQDPDPRKHIHVGWLCISEDSRRVEAGEIELATFLAEFMPVIAVVTKSRSNDGFRAVVQNLLPQTRNVVPVRAIREVFDDGHALEPKGLENLIAVTMDVIPEGQRRAFTAAQKLDIELKKTNLARSWRWQRLAPVRSQPRPFHSRTGHSLIQSRLECLPASPKPSGFPEMRVCSAHWSAVWSEARWRQ